MWKIFGGGGIERSEEKLSIEVWGEGENAQRSHMADVRCTTPLFLHFFT
jgi:hypothetical protein